MAFGFASSSGAAEFFGGYHQSVQSGAVFGQRRASGAGAAAGGAGGGAGGGAAGGATRGEPGVPVDNTSLYRILQITNDANHTQIKKAFHRLAMSHHPDKGGDSDKFKAIQAAYEVLKDPTMRRLYDAHGLEGMRRRVGWRGGRRGPRTRPVRRTADLRHALKVTLGEFYNGSERRLRLERDKVCPECKGLGGRPENLTVCSQCKGFGERGPVNALQTFPCSKCAGTGRLVSRERACATCKGRRVVKEAVTLRIHIEKGMAGGERRVFKSAASEAPTCTAGDVVVTFDPQEHKTFRRGGMHLHLQKKISLMEALSGFQFSFRHLDNRLLLVKSEKGIVYKPGDVKAIHDEGMPAYGNPFTKGNLYVEFLVEFPERLTEQHLEILSRVFPIPQALSPPGAEEVRLVTVDLDEENKRFEHLNRPKKMFYDDDREEDEGGAQQCRTQ